MNFLSIIPGLIMLLIDIYIFRHAKEIQKPGYQCQCGNTYQVNRMSTTIITIISLNLFIMIMSLLMSILVNRTPKLMVFAILVLFVFLASIIFQIYYIYLMITYVDDLKKHKCECVDKTFVDTVYYYGWGRLIIGVLGIVSVILLTLLFKKRS